MKAFLKRLLRRWLPRSMHRRLQHTVGWRWLRGNHATWAEAARVSSGYDDAAVLSRALDAARAVRMGTAAWDRDGTLFAEPAVHAPLLAALRRAAQPTGGLAVVDIGGAFGSVWWQHRTLLTELGPVRWRIVEQPAFVTAGQREFSDDVLTFHFTLAEACDGARPQVALLSSILPYIESPWALLTEVIARGFTDIIIDRTPFVSHGKGRLAVQFVPPELGGGSYPCWIFNSAQMLELLTPQYDLVADWPGFDDIAPGVNYRGFHFRRKITNQGA